VVCAALVACTPGAPHTRAVDRTTLPSAASTTGPSTTTGPTTTLAPLPSRLDADLVNTDACLLVRSADGVVAYSHNATLPLAPASTIKLLVAAAALDVVGPDYQFTTTVVAPARPFRGAVGALWLVGGGDPVLSSPEYTALLAAAPLTGGQPVATPISGLADQLVAAGVRAVPGGVHGDDSRYDRLRFLTAWKPSYAQEADVAPLGALEVDDGLDQFRPPVLTADPAAHAAGVLARLASAQGIKVAQAADATAPADGTVLATVVSPPLATIVTSMLRDSDNTAAEMLVRELDRATGGAGTTPGGLAVVARTAAALGLPVDGLRLDDGSGLAPTDRTTCTTLLDALDLSAQPRFAALGMLSLAGRYGTLVDRFLATPAVGQLLGKTGSIDGVASLVGRLGGTSFAFMLNGRFPYATGVAYEDRIVASIGGWG